jgi:predicted RNA binding protein YcfA (HicA-like mRNA interferase family)
MVRVLEAAGFRAVRIRGSHHLMKRGAQSTTVPVHRGTDLRIGTVRGILRDAEMTVDEFIALLGR